IFEIGGQDAKYVFLKNKVPIDYAMNEACSAGTGSFLEEAAKESLDVNYTEIGAIALKAQNPPNFNDQCAAFISSDIKNATHEGIKKEDIIAGLVYSICMNYVNRVKGNRPSGKRIFMQGGVCYNKAVPVAMAALTGKKIIVPPEPGLMGAFGVALELKNRMDLGLAQKQEFFLNELIKRKVTYHKSFKCRGDKNFCDRACEINLIEVNGKKYAFGGACNKYYNQLLNIKCDSETDDYVSLRQKLVYDKYVSLKPKAKAKTIGITKSFLTNTYYPLYYNFFTKLGLRVVLSENVDEKGTNKICSSFCYPAEIAHGFFYDLIKKKPDYIFLPHVTEIEVKDEEFYKRVCVFVQSETYYLKAAFKDEKLPKMLSPVISFGQGLEKAQKYFVNLALQLGFKKSSAREAYLFAVKQQRLMLDEFKRIGRELLEKIKKENKSAIVLFGRPYNAFTKEANLGIPRKFSSRNRVILPFDFLPFEQEKSFYHMYWGTGSMILKAAALVKKNPLLFGCYITNFSCGPDSFLISYFRNIMGVKPSLTLELDSHSADIGINTRVEAALDIMDRYTQLVDKGIIKEAKEDFIPAKVINKNKKVVVRVNNRNILLTDPRVTVVLPSMGELGTQALAAAFRHMKINCRPLPVSTMETLKIGRANTTCKECLPLILTTGSMLQYLQNRDDDEITLFFMPSGAGPCRQGQYHILQQELIRRLRLKNVAVLTAGDEQSFSNLGIRLLVISWLAILAAECLEDIRNTLRVLAVDNEEAIKTFDEEFKKVISVIETKRITDFFKQLSASAQILSRIPLAKPMSKAKFISLIGEVYVRREEFSRLDLINNLEKKGFILLPAPTAEYIYYCNYIRKKRLRKTTKKNLLKIYLTDFGEEYFEKKVRRTLAKSGLLPYELVDVDKTINHSKHLVSEHLFGESILTIGFALREIIHKSCGIISIGPFACMPSRFVESILTKEMNIKGKNIASKKNYDFNIYDLPFLAIETDGNVFPQIVQSRLEIFTLQADRLYEKMMQRKYP
nr:activase [Nanoarchaeota archaeon]